MSAKDDGGPAFPLQLETEHVGMSLRDWFAGQALPAVMALAADNSAEIRTSQAIAAVAYDMADVMLAERSK